MKLNRKLVLGILVLQITVFSSVGIGAQFSTNPLPVANPQSEGFSPEGLRRIDAFFSDQVIGNQLPGAVLAVAKNGKLVVFKSFGYLDKEKNVPMRTDAIFNLASMTKVMTAVGALTF